VRLLFSESNELLEVQEANDEGFRVATEKTGAVFVYGREVTDFHMVDYEALSMLHISATQGLVKQIDTLTERLALLEKYVYGQLNGQKKETIEK
jgi:hypothetical protein